MYVFVKQTCAVAWRDTVLRLKRGAIWSAEDPFVLERPEFFDTAPAVVHVHRSPGYQPPVADPPAPVEQATQVPGDKRATPAKTARKG